MNNNVSNIDKEWEEKLIDWTTFYRRNIHRFIEHYLGVKLYLYQKVWLYLMSRSTAFMCVASRASAKSYLIALYAVAKSILYPGTRTVIMSKTKDQAGLLVTTKIEAIFKQNYSNIAREIKDITANKGEYEVEFHNGSALIVVPASDNARGHRANRIIYEEFRLLNKATIDSVANPMQSVRQPPYLIKKEYEHLFEEPETIYISSAGFKSEWIWTELKKYVNNFYKGGDFTFFGLDYLISLKHNIKTKKGLEKEKESSGETTFLMEYCNLMLGESDNCFLSYDDFKKQSTLLKAFYPEKSQGVILKNKKEKAKEYGEIRLIAADIALASGKNNDNTVVICMSLLPTSKGYLRQVRYIETFNGSNSMTIVKRIKQIFFDFKADYFVLDVANAGRSLYDFFSKKTIDDERIDESGDPIEYEAFKLIENKSHHISSNDVVSDFENRTLMRNALPVIVPIYATAELNHLFHMEIKKNMNDGLIEYLIFPDEAEHMLYRNKKIDASTSVETKIDLLKPYLETNELINETTALESVWNNYKLKLVEPRSGRKDRYITLAYGNYFASILERDLQREVDNVDLKSLVGLSSNFTRNNLNNIFR